MCEPYVHARAHKYIHTGIHKRSAHISVRIHEDHLLVVNLRNHNAENAPGGLRSHLSRAKAVRKFERRDPRKPPKLPSNARLCLRSMFYHLKQE